MTAAAKINARLSLACYFHALTVLIKHKFCPVYKPRDSEAEFLREIALSRKMIIYTGSIDQSHMHLLIGIPPQLSVSPAVQYLQGKRSHRLMTDFEALRKRYWRQHLRTRGSYWVALSGNVTDDVRKEYIKNQTQPEPDDDFHVV